MAVKKAMAGEQLQFTGTTVPSTVPFQKLVGGGTGRAPFRVTVTVNRWGHGHGGKP
ncbi:hypothetical protein BT96DRAFT_1010719 [Gymnopus androsaceus JB14]|uniref:Uncharacterized protein n=1 Tax=Gymnopus androsaceus JB14 TaxID=1447944 RepID=A0A6A4GAF3_9AGAR|nr:hypothetical protein BT96DRAFT_1010719 [Gymnopus androsaceus JB14]